MATEAVLGETIRITVTFYDWSVEGGQGPLIDPDLVEGHVRDLALADLYDFTPTRLSVGTYQFEWLPTTLGEFYVEFVGTYNIDGSDDVVRDLFSVVPVVSNAVSLAALNEDQFLIFAGTMSPLYIDPEDLQTIYPDAPLVDIAEFIMVASEQVDAVRHQHPGIVPDITFNDLDYIRASALCSLQRIFDINAGQGGVLTLGDLTIENANFYKPHVNRAQAATWCELASVLWSELLQRSNYTFARTVGPFRGQGNDNPDPVLPRLPYRPYR